MKEILQEYGGFLLSIILIGALLVALTADGGFIESITENINERFDALIETK